MDKNKNKNARLLVAYENLDRLGRRLKELDDQLALCMRFVRYWQAHHGKLPGAS